MGAEVPALSRAVRSSGDANREFCQYEGLLPSRAG